MTASRVDFEIEQGSTFQKSIKFYKDDELTEPRDMSGFEWDMHIRKTEDSDESILELNSSDGDIDTSSQSEGKITINISSDTTADLDFTTGVYDLEYINESNRFRVLEGDIYLDKEVTR